LTTLGIVESLHKFKMSLLRCIAQCIPIEFPKESRSTRNTSGGEREREDVAAEEEMNVARGERGYERGVLVVDRAFVFHEPLD